MSTVGVVSLPETLYRTREFEAAPLGADASADDGMIRMVASTNAAVRVAIRVDGETQMWDEILEHDEESVDATSARALLLNHNADAIIGAIRSIRFDGNSAIVSAQVLPGAKMEATGVGILDAIRSGALKGVSIGYGYRTDNDTCIIDYEKRSIRVKKWRFSEASLTPIPADTAAGVRSLNQPASLKGSTHMTEVPAVTAQASPVAPVVADAAAIRAESTKIVSLAESLKLRSSDYVSLDLPAARAKMLEDIAARDAAAGGTPKHKVESHIEVGEEHSEKVAKRAVGALLWSAGFRHTEAAGEHEFDDGTKLKDYQAGNSLRGKKMTDVIRATCEALGQRTGEIDNEGLARIALGRDVGGKRDAANVSTGYFSSFVFLNLLKKAVSVGFTMGGKSIKYQPLVSRNYVPDYKQFAIGGMGMANLQKTVENEAFPELTKSEGVYLDRVSMWGGTISLSEQAVVSDDTGRFFDQLRQAGVIAQKTRDKRCFQKLLMGTSTSEATSTWTNNTTSATIVHTTNDQAVAARANLSKVEAALMNKIGLDGNPTGNMGSYLVVPPDLQYVAAGLMGVAPGMQNQTFLRYQVISSPWLQFTGLTGYSATSYYLVADPSEATGLVLSTINGVDEPRVEQYDPGAVAAYKWKIYDPFEIGMGAHTIGGNAIIAGIQQGT